MKDPKDLKDPKDPKKTNLASDPIATTRRFTEMDTYMSFAIVLNVIGMFRMFGMFRMIIE
jgi:hypothetical protein